MTAEELWKGFGANKYLKNLELFSYNEFQVIGQLPAAGNCPFGRLDAECRGRTRRQGGENG